MKGSQAVEAARVSNQARKLIGFAGQCSAELGVWTWHSGVGILSV